jgi:hypothetical protein
MALFTVTDIIDGNTIRVSGWSWNNLEGERVRIAGFNPQGADYIAFAKNKLQTLLKDKKVELKNVISSEKGTKEKDDLITCSVYLNDIDISQYFPELKTPA